MSHSHQKIGHPDKEIHKEKSDLCDTTYRYLTHSYRRLHPNVTEYKF
jgi:hypothetical protein